jgi:hypothetical protein
VPARTACHLSPAEFSSSMGTTAKQLGANDAASGVREASTTATGHVQSSSPRGHIHHAKAETENGDCNERRDTEGPCSSGARSSSLTALRSKSSGSACGPSFREAEASARSAREKEEGQGK